jgi:ribosomal protein S18 acetylase RimI-like enzyme/ASC-1-like (ASCH) protein
MGMQRSRTRSGRKHLKPVIRPATPADFDAVASLMSEALTPYYGGDHRRHAERIFSTHISGGEDRLGFFSTEQKMFVAEVSGVFAGMIHVVAKRQGTFKISPLIVVPRFRHVGVGKALLSHAESYAGRRGARQMYCTVAIANESAYRFFARNGYIGAGQSPSHYKDNVTEAMLYKIFDQELLQSEFDLQHISITPFDETLRDGVRDLLLKHLPERFAGIDDAWVDSLFEGYRRRDTRDVNSKYKLIFVATDSSGCVRGVVGATPKKGAPIKLMPVVSEDPLVLEALLRDVPYMLKEFGRKLYIHIQPSARETVYLQKLGWTLDAVMPGAYGEQTVTQQWSFDLVQETRRNMRMKKRFFDLIMSGEKDLEVRVAYDQITKIREGDILRLSTHAETAEASVVAIRRYPDFAAMLAVEDPKRIVPDDPSNIERLLSEIYPPHKERLGVVVLEITPNTSGR